MKTLPSVRSCFLAFASMAACSPPQLGAANPVPFVGTAKAAVKPDSPYVQVWDGHLYRNGQRIRLWGMIGGWPKDPKKHPNAKALIDEEVDRIKKLGFNAIRFWNYPDETPYVKGDNSANDIIDYNRWKLKEAGFLIWAPNVVGVPALTPADVNIINDPVTADGWREAVTRKIGTGDKTEVETRAHPWDPRAGALARQMLERRLKHVNQYTGIPFGEDESVAILELTNEEWWFSHMAKGRMYKEIPYLQQSFLQRWNAWLKDRYGDDAKLRQAWTGSLLETESLSNSSVMYIPPDGTGAEEQMKTLGVAIPDYAANKLTPSDLSRSRNGDAVRFLLDLQLEYKKELYDLARQQAPKGIGCNIIPILLDTGFNFDIQSPYLHWHGDASAHDVYIGGFTNDPQHPRYPWRSGVEEPPRLYAFDPWLEQNKLKDKPFLVYEIGFFRPSKYHAELPMRVAALGAIQDWDAVMWHYWGHARDPKDPKRYDSALDYCTVEHYWQGAHYQFDEIHSSQMQVAGEMFKNGSFKPVAKPTTISFGKDSPYDPGKIRFGELGSKLAATTYRYGLQLDFDVNADGDVIEGPIVQRGQDGLPPIIKPTEEIAFAWHDGRMVLDSPAAKSIVGFLPPDVQMEDGVSLSNLRLASEPKEGVEPKDRYICFALASTDGKPLPQSSRALVSLVSTSVNTDFAIDTKKLTAEHNPKVLAAAITNFGKAPVLVDRVSGTLRAPWLKGRTARFLDWHFNVMSEAKLTDGELKISSEQPAYLVEIVK